MAVLEDTFAFWCRTRADEVAGLQTHMDWTQRKNFIGGAQCDLDFNYFHQKLTALSIKIEGFSPDESGEEDFASHHSSCSDQRYSTTSDPDAAAEDPRSVSDVVRGLMLFRILTKRAPLICGKCGGQHVVCVELLPLLFYLHISRDLVYFSCKFFCEC